MWVNEETSTGVLLGAAGCGGAATGDGSTPPAAARPPSMERRVVQPSMSATGTGLPRTCSALAHSGLVPAEQIGPFLNLVQHKKSCWLGISGSTHFSDSFQRNKSARFRIWSNLKKLLIFNGQEQRNFDI